MPLGEEGCGYTNQGDHRTDGEIDAAGNHHDRHPDGENSIDGNLQRHIDKIIEGQEARGQEGKNRALHKDGEEDHRLRRARLPQNSHGYSIEVRESIGTRRSQKSGDRSQKKFTARAILTPDSWLMTPFSRKARRPLRQQATVPAWLFRPGTLPPSRRPALRRSVDTNPGPPAIPMR